MVHLASFTCVLFSYGFFFSPVSDVHLRRVEHDEYRALGGFDCLWNMGFCWVR